MTKSRPGVLLGPPLLASGSAAAALRRERGTEHPASPQQRNLPPLPQQGSHVWSSCPRSGAAPAPNPVSLLRFLGVVLAREARVRLPARRPRASGFRTAVAVGQGDTADLPLRQVACRAHASLGNPWPPQADHARLPGGNGCFPLSILKRGYGVPEFEEAAFSAPLNKVVRCKTKFGWHLVQVLAERDQCVLQDIDPEQLHAKLQDPSFLEEAQLIDVREPDEVNDIVITKLSFILLFIFILAGLMLNFYYLHGREKASLPGFKVLPLRQFGTWGPVMTDEFNPQKDTYVLCHHGMRSMQVAKWLQSQGFKKVYNVAGGIHAYAVKADSSIPTY
ncbi:Rhodanese-like/PpiC domain-containing protein 12, chloroplastic [Zea mays]|uniref:Rhodanese-like/PpiC domain-containing protein 12, chloroplastic n=1 Tax=Zea mays TaxID=4577 RepID=A0A3L6E3R5_MAIZE|nr:Rhodanese-like/PpiC domain-containing protein 12, chloroplastic [Zea mays]